MQIYKDCMSNLINFVGQKFGRLTVIKEAARKRPRHRAWLCQCDCGNTIVIGSSYEVTSGNTSSCGCYKREKNREKQLKHGLTHSRTYNCWSDIKKRCYNENSKSYKNYGGRGIKVCDRWKNSFENFYADMGECPDGYTIERINVNGDYEPSNCKWIKPSEQAINKTSNHYITINGETKCLAEWCRFYGIKVVTVRKRVANLGMTWEDAITQPSQGKARIGSNHPMSKLNEGKVREIRNRRHGGERAIDLQKEFGLKKGTYDKIMARKTWKHVD